MNKFLDASQKVKLLFYSILHSRKLQVTLNKSSLLTSNGRDLCWIHISVSCLGCNSLKENVLTRVKSILGHLIVSFCVYELYRV